MLSLVIKHLLRCLSLCLPLVMASCQATTPLESPPWQGNAAGSQSWLGKFGLFTVYGAESDLEVTSPLTGDSLIEASLDTEMIGRGGIGGGYQHFLRDDFALLVSLEARYTDAVITDPPLTVGGKEVFIPGDVLQFQGTIGGRYWLPVQWGREGRLRPFLGIDLNYIPETNFDLLANLNDTISIDSEFKGSAYWTLGLCLGLSYQWTEDITVHFTAFYEKGLSPSEDVVYLPIPGVDPSFIPPYPTNTSVDAEGLIGFLSLNWGF